MELVTSIFMAITTALAGYIYAYTKEKGKNLANKEDFEDLKNQLSENTATVEAIKSKVSEKSWIDQQTWNVKKESYDSIFELFFYIKKYVSVQVSEFEEWDMNKHKYPELAYEIHDDGYQVRIYDLEKDEFEEKSKDPSTKKEAETLKIKYEHSMESLFRLIEVKAIYIDEKVEKIAFDLKVELNSTHEYESWDEHFYRIERSTIDAIENVRQIGKEELKLSKKT